jgi:hypothetical protein
MVCDSAFRCDRDQQASLLGNVVILCGGGACITGVLLVWAVQVSRVVLLFLVQMALWRGSYGLDAG